MPLRIRLCKAQNGDCIILEYGTQLEHAILIDGGIGAKCQRQLRNFFQSRIKEEKKIDLLILTHLDSDHISGILSLFSWKEFDPSGIKEMWFNYGTELIDKPLAKCEDHNKTYISMKQGNMLNQLLQENCINWKNKVLFKKAFQSEKLKIQVLSPDSKIWEEFLEKGEIETHKSNKIIGSNDYALSVEYLDALVFEGKVTLENKSSIAVLLEYEGHNALFLGDASADTIVTALTELGYSQVNPLETVCCKIAHHASKHNTSAELIELIRCHNYLISTNLTASGRPSKECLSRIVCHSVPPTNFYCNYEIKAEQIFSREEIETYQIHFITMKETGIELGELRNARRTN